MHNLATFSILYSPPPCSLFAMATRLLLYLNLEHFFFSERQVKIRFNSWCLVTLEDLGWKGVLGNCLASLDNDKWSKVPFLAHIILHKHQAASSFFPVVRWSPTRIKKLCYSRSAAKVETFGHFTQQPRKASLWGKSVLWKTLSNFLCLRLKWYAQGYCFSLASGWPAGLQVLLFSVFFMYPMYQFVAHSMSNVGRKVMLLSKDAST